MSHVKVQNVSILKDTLGSFDKSATALWLKRYTTRLILLSVLITSWFIVKDHALANLHFYQAKQAVERWETYVSSDSETDYIEVKLAISRANHLHPDHPLYIDLLAQVYEWGVLGKFEPVNTGLREAKALYLSSTRLRPTWPVTWASLAMIKWRMEEFDEEMIRYLSSAAKYGPNQPEVHTLFVELGLALYQSDNPLFLTIAQEVKSRLALGLSHPLSVRRIQDAISRHSASGVACRWLKDQSRHVQAKLGCIL